MTSAWDHKILTGYERGEKCHQRRAPPRNCAVRSWQPVYKPEYDYRRAGVTLGGLELADLVAKRLWETEWYERQPRLALAADPDTSSRQGGLAGWLAPVIYPPQPENPATVPTNPTPHPA